MPLPRFLLFAVALGCSLGGTAALAATCDVNIENAYTKAVQNGWSFKCLKGVLHFDKSKRPGCVSKPVLPLAWEEARFFNAQSPRDEGKNGSLKNGWRVKSYQITGGQYEKKPLKGYSRVNFTFSTKAGSYHRRYLSKLVLEKSGGSCSNVLNEAFE